MIEIISFLTVLLLLETTRSQTLVSPCPDIFKYDEQTADTGIWFGTLTLTNNDKLSGVWVRVVFDKSSTQVENWFGTVVPEPDYKEFLIKNPKHELLANTPLKIRFLVKYKAEEAPPQLIKVKLNGREVCGKEKNSSELLPLSITNKVNYELVSPCPEQFQYEKQTEDDRWFGSVTLVSPGKVHGVWVRIIMDKPAIQLGNWFAPVENIDNNTQFVIKNTSHVLQPNEPFKIRFYLIYDPLLEIPPMLKEFRLNAITICPVTNVNKQPSLFISEVVPHL